MTRDDIIRMAREAGGWKQWEARVMTPQVLERFAALIAAAVEERLKWDGLHSCHSECDRPACVHTRKAVEAEREACANVCDEKVDAEYATGKVDHNEMGWTQACAIAIRARGQK